MPVGQLHPILVLTLIAGAALLSLMLVFALMSWREHEPRATRRALLLAVLLSLPYFLVALIPQPTQTLIAAALIGVSALGAIVLILPLNTSTLLENDTPQGRIDERDIMFSRMNLEPGSTRFEDYYRRHPDKRPLDDRFRRRPGLLQPGALYYEPIAAAATNASFATVAAFHPILDETTEGSGPMPLDPGQMTRFVKWWARKLGAVSVGITELRDYHLYSHIGRGPHYGKPVEIDHRFAIALTVEMDKHAMDRAPFGPTAMESAQQYLASGAIAVQIAQFIHGLGYGARAHIDGNYRVVCPLVARDAGLGEIGRMGLLLTPQLGPRVRLAVVTTDLPLIASQRQPDPTMIDFCTHCKKCADVCPPRAISFGDRSEIAGALRWQINSEACFTYWCTVGTDCGRCMRVCPYSHPNNLLHNLVRAGLRQSTLFRRFALVLDDFFYGRKPEPRPVPAWMQVSQD